MYFCLMLNPWNDHIYFNPKNALLGHPHRWLNLILEIFGFHWRFDSTMNFSSTLSEHRPLTHIHSDFHFTRICDRKFRLLCMMCLCLIEASNTGKKSFLFLFYREKKTSFGNETRIKRKLKHKWKKNEMLILSFDFSRFEETIC